MCLEKVTKRIPFRVQKGWKFFQKAKNGNLICQYRICQDGSYMPGRWYEATKQKIGYTDNKYFSGFHFYFSRPKYHMKHLELRQVELLGVRVIGLENGQKVGVADYMKILETK